MGRGTVLLQLGRLEEALASYDAAIGLHRDAQDAHSNRGIALTALGRAPDALASFDRAIAIRPNYPEAFVGRGNALRELNRPDEAIDSYDRALVLRPDYADAHVGKSVSLLLRGDFARGWAEFEWRWKKSVLSTRPRIPEFAQHGGRVSSRSRGPPC